MIFETEPVIKVFGRKVWICNKKYIAKGKKIIVSLLDGTEIEVVIE